MAVIVNNNTRQSPMSAQGLTGAQAIRFIDCPRIYIKAVDSTPAPVAVKSNGVAPSGWTDLGIVNGKAKIQYTKDMTEVRTGVDNVLRAVFITKKTAKFDFTLDQFDDVVMAQLSGITGTGIGTATSGVYPGAFFPLGAEDVIQKALLVVSQNKLDGKEWQFYHPSAYMSFQITDSGDQTSIAGTGDLPMFDWTPSGGSLTESIMVASIFA